MLLQELFNIKLEDAQQLLNTLVEFCQNASRLFTGEQKADLQFILDLYTENNETNTTDKQVVSTAENNPAQVSVSENSEKLKLIKESANTKRKLLVDHYTHAKKVLALYKEKESQQSSAQTSHSKVVEALDSFIQRAFESQKKATEDVDSFKAENIKQTELQKTLRSKIEEFVNEKRKIDTQLEKINKEIRNSDDSFSQAQVKVDELSAKIDKSEQALKNAEFEQNAMQSVKAVVGKEATARLKADTEVKREYANSQTGLHNAAIELITTLDELLDDNLKMLDLVKTQLETKTDEIVLLMCFVEAPVLLKGIQKVDELWNKQIIVEIEQIRQLGDAPATINTSYESVNVKFKQVEEKRKAVEALLEKEKPKETNK